MKLNFFKFKLGKAINLLTLIVAFVLISCTFQIKLKRQNLNKIKNHSIARHKSLYIDNYKSFPNLSKSKSSRLLEVNSIELLRKKHINKVDNPKLLELRNKKKTKRISKLRKALKNEANSGIRVDKWIYIKKYGLGYSLTNGCIGVSFNDDTKILEINEYDFNYIKWDSVKKQDIINVYTLTEYPKNTPEKLEKKVKIFKVFKDVLNENQTTKQRVVVDFIKNNEGHEDKNDPNKNTILYVKWWIKTDKAVLFRFSNKLIQTYFKDDTQIIINVFDSKQVTYFNEKNEESSFQLDTINQSNHKDLQSKLFYTKKLMNMLNENPPSKDPKESKFITNIKKS